MTSMPENHPSCKGVWLPIVGADKSKVYDLCVSDGKGYSWRETNCRWKRGGRYGKAGWYFVADEGCGPQWWLAEAASLFKVTHFMEVPELPK